MIGKIQLTSLSVQTLRNFSGECKDGALRYYLAQNRFAEKLFVNSNSNEMALNKLIAFA